MRIATWNINSVRLRLGLLENFTSFFQPEVLCLQETKVQDAFFPIKEIESMGYKHVAYIGQKSYNGVAILSKYPITGVFSCDFYNQDRRHIAGLINGIEIHNFYVPAGGDEPDEKINPKFKHKLEYIKFIQKWFLENRNKDDKIILLGDLNIAPHANDVWSTKQLKNVVSHTLVERDLLISLQESFNFIDSARYFTNMEEKLYSWWSYRNKDWRKSDRGRRLDHIWASSPLEEKLRSVQIIKDARSWSKPSDHVPLILDLQQLD